MPKTNRDYWESKLKRNVQRDAAVKEQLQCLGWRVITIWECELKKAIREETLDKLYLNIIQEEMENK